MTLLHIWLRELIIFSRPGNFVILLLEKTKRIKNMTAPVTIINKVKILHFLALSRIIVPDIRRKCHHIYWPFILYGNTLLLIEIYFIPIIANIKNDGRQRNNVWRMKYFQSMQDNQIICDMIFKGCHRCLMQQ